MSENQQSSSENDKKEKKKSPRKRQVHNEVERRRKDKINAWIMKIWELLPHTELHKASKIGILEQTVGYIKELIAERDKLLSEHCSDVQENEMKSLKKKIVFLEAQNALYVKLLQEAKISIASLPKKQLKYSNKFTEETREKLLRKLNSEARPFAELTTVNNSTVISSDSVSTDTSNSMQNSVTVTAINAFSSCSIVNSNTVQNIFVQNHLNLDKAHQSSNSNSSFKLISPKVSEVHEILAPVPQQNPPLNYVVSHINEIRNISSIVTIPTCVLDTRTTCSSGGVTSALSPFPVMSSTLGSSFGNIYSRNIPTVIILPQGGSFVQPPLLSSNISVISPAVESVLPIIVPHQSNNVPTTSINILCTNKINEVTLPNMSNCHPPSLSFLPNKDVVSVSVPSSGDTVVCSAATNTSTSTIVSESSRSEIEKIPTFNQFSRKDSVLSAESSTLSSSPLQTQTSVSSPVPSKSKDVPSESEVMTKSDCTSSKNVAKNTVLVQQQNNIENSPKIYVKNTPPSLQVLSSSKIISSISLKKIQLQNNSNCEVSAESNSVSGIISLPSEENDTSSFSSPKNNIEPLSQSADSPVNDEPLPASTNGATVLESSAVSSPNISQPTTSEEKNSKSSETQNSTLLPLESFTLEECTANLCQDLHSESVSTMSQTKEVQSVKEQFNSNSNTNQYNSFFQNSANDVQSSKETEMSNNFNNAVTSENSSTIITESNLVISESVSCTSSNMSQVLSWSNNLLDLDTNDGILNKPSHELESFEISSVEKSNNEVELANQESVNVNSSQTENSKNMPSVPQYINSDKSACIDQSEVTASLEESNTATLNTSAYNSTTRDSVEQKSEKSYTSDSNTEASNSIQSACPNSATLSASVDSSVSQLYSDISYLNMTSETTSMKNLTDSEVTWDNSASLNNSNNMTLSVKDNSYSFSSTEYQSVVSLIDANSCSSNFLFEKPKEKTNGLKSKSKSVKKVKPLCNSNSTSFAMLPDVTTNMENFANATCDLFSSAQIIAEQGNNHQPNQTEKSDNLTCASDILAKAAESIFGNDTFHSMDITAQQTSSQRPGISYNVATSYSNTDVFDHVFPAPETSKIENYNYNNSKFTDLHCQDPNLNKIKISSSTKLNSTLTTDNIACYSNNSQPYTRIRKSNCNSEDEPQAKKSKDNLLTVTSSSTSVVTSSCSQELALNKDTSNDEYKSNSSEQQKQINGREKPTETNVASSRSTIDLQTASTCFPAQPPAFYSMAKKQINFNTEAQNVPLSQSSQVICNTGISTESYASNSNINQNSLSSHITHPVNSLFINNSTPNSKNKTSEKLDNRINCHTSLYGSDPVQNASFYSTNKESMTSKPNISSSNNYIQSTQAANNSLSSFLNYSNTMLFHNIHNQSTLVPPPTNQFDLFPSHSSQSTSVNETKLHNSNTSYFVELPNQQYQQLNSSQAVTQDSANRMQTSYSSHNVQTRTNTSSIQNRTCIQTPVSSTSLSYSLCSLLKESPSNSVPKNVTVSSNTFSSASTPLDINVPVSSVSKYSALSLISDHSYLTAKTTAISKSTNTLVSSNNSQSTTTCSKNSKSSLSYSAERLIQTQCTHTDRDKNKTTSNITPDKSADNGLYKVGNYKPPASLENNMQNLSHTSLASATSYPTFPSTFSVCNVRSTDMRSNPQYQNIPQSSSKDIFSRTTNFGVSSHMQNNSCTAVQNVSSIPKTQPNLALNFENSPTIYNSCNFLQPPIHNIEPGKSSENNSCFPPIFVNSNYSQQSSKKNCCHFVNQMPTQVSEISVDKTFSVMPPITPFTDKPNAHDHRQSNDNVNSSNYVSNVFFEPSSCTHESVGSNKPSTQRTSQESYVPHRTKQGSTTTQASCISNSIKPLPQSKNKTKKAKHISNDLSRTNVFTPNNCMNFNVFTVPELPCGKPPLHHVPSNYKNTSQSVIPSIADMQTQQGKISDSILSSVISPHHTPFNTNLHQQNDLLNLNFQTPSYSGTSLTMHPPIPLSSCSTTAKTTRSFSSIPNPVPNFNLSNILPDMGCSSTDLGFSSIKFPSECPPSSTATSSILSASHQTCTSSLYTPHPPVVPNALPSLLNHTPHSLNRNRPPLPTPANIPTIPQPPHFSSPQTQPFQNIIHSLNFTRSER